MTEERLGRIIRQDEKYQAARIQEKGEYDRLKNILSDEQIELFNKFTLAAEETDANVQRIIYQQGMKDMFALLKSLS